MSKRFRKCYIALDNITSAACQIKSAFLQPTSANCSQRTSFDIPSRGSVSWLSRFGPVKFKDPLSVRALFALVAYMVYTSTKFYIGQLKKIKDIFFPTNKNIGKFLLVYVPYLLGGWLFTDTRGWYENEQKLVLRV